MKLKLIKQFKQVIGQFKIFFAVKELIFCKFLVVSQQQDFIKFAYKNPISQNQKISVSHSFNTPKLGQRIVIIKKMISDALLRNYVDEVFMTYDRDRSGSLQPAQLANFFNDVFQKMHNPNRYTVEQATQALRQIDSNFDGRATKSQLFEALKRLMGQTGFSNDDYNGNKSRVSETSTAYNATNYSQNSPRNAQNMSNYPSTQNNYVSSSNYSATSTYGQQPQVQNQYTSQSYGQQSYSTPQTYSSNNQPYSAQSYGQPPVPPVQLTSPSIISTTYNPSVLPETSYIETTRTLQPSTMLLGTGAGTGSGSVIGSSGISRVTEVAQPGFSKITTTTTAPGYSKTTTETFTSTTTYTY